MHSSRLASFYPLHAGGRRRRRRREWQWRHNDGLIRLQRSAAIADCCDSKLCFIMFGGHSFCLANATSDNQKYSQSSNCERNPIDENVNPGLVLSNQLPALAMAPPPFNTSSNTLSKKVPLHCTPSFSAHPASAGRPTYGILNPSTAQ